MGHPEGGQLVEFIEVMRRLRAECPWKAEQTHRSLARYLLEETHETLEAIDLGDDDHLREELGDLLLQVYFHAAIAEERGAWSIDDVAADVIAKMRRRNPHVFGSSEPSALTAAEVNDAWQVAKAAEKSTRSTVTDGLPPGLPALLYADKVLDRLARTTHAPVVAATTPSGDAGEQLGDRLLALVAEARAEGIDPEQALRDAVRRLL